MSTLNINGFNMFYQESGQGEALFLVSGFSGNHRMWYNIVPMLNDKYRVIQLDNRGAGFSDVPETGFTIFSCIASAMNEVTSMITAGIELWLNY